MLSPQVDYTMRTLAAKHLGAARSELAAADVPGRPALFPRLVLPYSWIVHEAEHRGCGLEIAEGHATCTGNPNFVNRDMQASLRTRPRCWAWWRTLRRTRGWRSAWRPT